MEINEFADRRWTLWNGVKRPSRYVGGEWGAALPDESPSSIRFCLAFPDVYEVGMSFVGYQILYGLLRDMEGVSVERAYCPWPDMEEALRGRKEPLTSLEGGRSLGEFDIVGFTLQYELSATGILTVLDLGGIPLRSVDRGDGDPFVVAGGPGALAPEPLAPFFDVFCLGDGEELMPDLIRLVKETEGQPRLDRLKAIAGAPGFYVPLFVDVTSGESGLFFRSDLPLPLRRRVVLDLDKAYFPSRMIVPSTGIVHDRLALEVFRGCTRGCRFCQAGMLYRPLRERSPETIVAQAKSLLETTGWEELGLLSLATCDYSGLSRVLDDLTPFLEERRIKLSLPSLRMDRASVELASRLESRKGSLTFAPEAGSQRLRDVINKGVSEEDIEGTLEALFDGGWQQVKLYFMMGLPTETRSDLEGIIDICNLALRLGRSRKAKVKVSASVAGFVPKAHTPFQWEPQLPMDDLRERGRYLRSLVRDRYLTLHYHEPEQTFLEGVFSRGDRRLADVIEEAWRRGARLDGWTEHFNLATWMEAFEACSVDPVPYAQRRRSLDEGLPWDHIDSGLSRSFLLAERARAFEGKTTPDCRGGCNGCGWESRGCPLLEGGSRS